jgi:hypothetical protein
MGALSFTHVCPSVRTRRSCVWFLLNYLKRIIWNLYTGLGTFKWWQKVWFSDFTTFFHHGVMPLFTLAESGGISVLWTLPSIFYAFLHWFLSICIRLQIFLIFPKLIPFSFVSIFLPYEDIYLNKLYYVIFISSIQHAMWNIHTHTHTHTHAHNHDYHTNGFNWICYFYWTT